MDDRLYRKTEKTSTWQNYTISRVRRQETAWEKIFAKT